MRGALVAALLLACLLAGCGTPTGQGTATAANATGMHVAGLVEADTLLPLSNATVHLVEANLTTLTRDDGSFEFPLVPPRVYSVQASMAGFASDVLVARPDTNAGSLDFVLQRAITRAPRQEQFHFRGHMDCALQTPALGGSCDAGSGTLANQTRYDFVLAAPWNTTVIDVVFSSDGSTQPGVGGFRLAVHGNSQDAPVGTDILYGRFEGTASYTARLDPGTLAPQGARPVDANTSRFSLQLVPLGRCLPPSPAPCLEQVGGGVNVEVELFVTVFYVTPAPAGFTIRTNA